MNQSPQGHKSVLPAVTGVGWAWEHLPTCPGFTCALGCLPPCLTPQCAQSPGSNLTFTCDASKPSIFRTNHVFLQIPGNIFKGIFNERLAIFPSRDGQPWLSPCCTFPFSPSVWCNNPQNTWHLSWQFSSIHLTIRNAQWVGWRPDVCACIFEFQCFCNPLLPWV